MNMHHLRSFLCSLFLCLALLPTGCKRADISTDEKPPSANVKWDKPTAASVEEWVELIGTTVPSSQHSASVSTSIDGRVASIFPGQDPTIVATMTVLGIAGDPFQNIANLTALGQARASEGQYVVKGTALVTLDDTVARRKLAQLEENQVGLQTDLQRSQLAVDLAQAEVDALGKLSDMLKSPREILNANNALLTARTGLDGARSKLAAGIHDIEAQRTLVNQHILRAPIHGRVSRIQVVLGQSLAMGTAITEIVDISDTIDVVCYVSPAQVRRLEVGQTVKSGGFDEHEVGSIDKSAFGTIIAIAAKAESETGNVVVLIRLDNKQANLRANCVMNVIVNTSPTNDDFYAVDTAALMEDENTPSVIIVEKIEAAKNDEGKDEQRGEARRMYVTLGSRDRIKHLVQIKEMYDPEKKTKWPGDIKDVFIITKGGLGVRTGDKVKMAPDED